MSCPYTDDELSANVPNGASHDKEFWTSVNSSSDTSILFQHFSVWDSEGRDIKYCNGWSAWCSDLHTIFKSDISLVVCSLYPNITRLIDNDQLGANWTTVGFNPSDKALIRGLNSQIPSCLIGYCALIPACAATQQCLSTNLYTLDGSISGAGMRACWYQICFDWHPHVNSDIGGIGVFMSPTDFIDTFC